VNTTDLYHCDGVVCSARWSCTRPDHTTVPPKCGGRDGRRPTDCELSAGHPGPHVPVA